MGKLHIPQRPLAPVSFDGCKGKGGICGSAKGSARIVNGYATGIFYLLYRLFPRLMQLDDKAYGDTKVFSSDYGVAESDFELTEEEYQSARRTAVCKKKKRLLPGASPLVYARLLMEDVRGQAAGSASAAVRKIAAQQGQIVLPRRAWMRQLKKPPWRAWRLP